jgi:ribonuclease HI
MPWICRLLRDNRVYVRVNERGEPLADRSGRVEIVYKLAPGAKTYNASVANLEPTGDAADELPIESDIEVGATDTGRKSNGTGAPVAIPDGAIIVYTDGACTGNPGPCGIGVVIMAGTQREELSEYLGMGTNNIAELTAIERALEEIPEGDRQRPIYIHSDSSYSIGLLTKNWKAKANQELVARLRALTRQFPNLHLVKVKGHSGVPENERADELARDAVVRRA